MLPRYCLSDFEMVSVAPLITGTTFVSTFHMRCIYSVRYYLLTPWCRVLLEKLTGLQLVKIFPSISRNPKVHYRTHKHPPPVSILGQPNLVHIPTFHLLEIHLNIVHPSTPRSPRWSPSFRFPHQDPIHPPQLTQTLHMPRWPLPAEICSFF